MRRAALLLAALALAGCSTVEDTAAPPAELTDFERGARLTEVWRGTTGDAFNEKWVRMAPVLDGDVLYSANVAGQVTAFDVADGDRRWRTDVGSWLSAGVGVGGGSVYVGSAEGTVIALDAADGTVRWRRDVTGELLAPPAVASNSPTVFVRTVDGRVMALNSENGETRWTHEGDVPALSLRGNSQPLSVPGGVLVGQDNGMVVALHGGTGEPLWQTQVAPPEGETEIERMVDIDGNMGIGDDVLYAVTYQGKVAEIEPSEGNIGWSRELSSYAGLTVDPQRIYVTDAASHVRALDHDSGSTLWRQDALAHRRLTAAVPVPGTGFLAVADYDGYVHLLTRADGRIVARFRTGGFGVMADPEPLSEGRFAIQTQGAKLLVLDAEALTSE